MALRALKVSCAASIRPADPVRPPEPGTCLQPPRPWPRRAPEAARRCHPSGESSSAGPRLDQGAVYREMIRTARCRVRHSLSDRPRRLATHSLATRGAKVIHLKELTDGLVTCRDWHDNCVADDRAGLPFTLAPAASLLADGIGLCRVARRRWRRGPSSSTNRGPRLSQNRSPLWCRSRQPTLGRSRRAWRNEHRVEFGHLHHIPNRTTAGACAEQSERSMQR
jgi:hypothetical protein